MKNSPRFREGNLVWWFGNGITGKDKMQDYAGVVISCDSFQHNTRRYEDPVYTTYYEVLICNKILKIHEDQLFELPQAIDNEN